MNETSCATTNGARDELRHCMGDFVSSLIFRLTDKECDDSFYAEVLGRLKSLLDYIETGQDEDEAEEIKNSFEDEFKGGEFTSAELRRIFKLRLKTQDRVLNANQNVPYPISFIRELYGNGGKKAEFGKMLDRWIDDISLSVKDADGTVFKANFSDIDGMEICADRSVKVKLKGKEYPLCEPDDPTEIKASAMCMVSIDHSTEICEAINRLPTSSQLYVIAEFLNNNKTFGNKEQYLAHIRKMKETQKGNYPRIDFAELEKDLNSLNSGLRLMSLHRNVSRKNDKPKTL